MINFTKKETWSILFVSFVSGFVVAGSLATNTVDDANKSKNEAIIEAKTCFETLYTVSKMYNEEFTCFSNEEFDFESMAKEMVDCKIEQ